MATSNDSQIDISLDNQSYDLPVSSNYSLNCESFLIKHRRYLELRMDLKLLTSQKMVNWFVTCMKMLRLSMKLSFVEKESQVCILGPILYTVYCVPYYTLCTVSHTIHCILCPILYTVYWVPYYTLCTGSHTIHCVLCPILCTVYWVPYYILCTGSHTIHCILCPILYTVYCLCS